MNSTHWAIVILTTVAALLGGAQFMEHVLRLDPCPLCMMQRLWFIQVGFVACFSIAHNSRLRVYPLLMFMGSAIGAGFSIRQLYLQSLPADQVPSCGADLEYLIEYFPLTDILREMIMGSGNCAEVVWSFLGLSLPAYALLGFILLACLSVAQWQAGTIPHHPVATRPR